MKAVFFDRDGTLIVDPPDLRVDSVKEIELFPDTLEALTELAKLDYGVFIVSNQAGIGEGRFTREEYDAIQKQVIERLRPSGIKILASYVCPHRPDDNCVCRKPKPFMLLQSAKEFDIDLASSFMIGDRQSDILAGQAAGTKTILVQTANTPVTSPDADYTAPNLLAAVRYIATY